MDLHTIELPGVDRELACKEFASGPLYQDLLISPDLKVTGLLVNLKPDVQIADLMQQRQAI